MSKIKKASLKNTRRPFHAISQPQEILTALNEILQRSTTMRDHITERLVRSIIEVVHDNKVDWSTIKSPNDHI